MWRWITNIVADTDMKSEHVDANPEQNVKRQGDNGRTQERYAIPRRVLPGLVLSDGQCEFRISIS